MLLPVIGIYLVLINIIAFCFYGVDKRKAKKGAWRIPEATLILLAFIGGSVGALLGMLAFHHKTKHPKFYILVPLFLLLHIAAAIYVYLSFIA